MGSGGLQQILQQFQGQGGNQLGNLGNIPRSMPSGGNFGAGGPQMPGGSTIPQEPMQGPQWGNMPNSGFNGLTPTSGPTGPQGVRGPGSPNDSFPGQMQPKTPMQPGNSKGGPSMSASILPGMQQMQPTQAQAGSAMAAPMKSPWGANSLRGPGGF